MAHTVADFETKLILGLHTGEQSSFVEVGIHVHGSTSF